MMADARTRDHLLGWLLAFWGGGALFGNMIAAPAKFQAPSLTMPVALDVGRAQFQWLGMAEAVCAIAILALLLWRRRAPGWPLLAALGLFALQRLWLMPLLDERTLAVIAGQPVGESRLHLVYVAAEIVKIGLLLWASCRIAQARNFSHQGQESLFHSQAKDLNP